MSLCQQKRIRALRPGGKFTFLYFDNELILGSTRVMKAINLMYLIKLNYSLNFVTGIFLPFLFTTQFTIKI